MTLARSLGSVSLCSAPQGDTCGPCTRVSSGYRRKQVGLKEPLAAPPPQPSRAPPSLAPPQPTAPSTIFQLLQTPPPATANITSATKTTAVIFPPPPPLFHLLHRHQQHLNPHPPPPRSAMSPCRPCEACGELLAALLRLLRRIVDGGGRCVRRGVALLKRAALGRAAGGGGGRGRSGSAGSSRGREGGAGEGGAGGLRREYDGDDTDSDDADSTAGRRDSRAEEVLLKAPPAAGVGEDLSTLELSAATQLLRSIESGEPGGSLDEKRLQWLAALASSSEPRAQEPAAVYFLHAGRTAGCTLPEESVPLLLSLLRSEDARVQSVACEALHHLLKNRAVGAEVTVQAGAGGALVDALESGDTALQASACVCLGTLLDTGRGCERELVAAGVVASLAVLAKSYELPVQRSAVTAVHSLARTETGRAALHSEGALPVLVLLLQSGDPEVQHRSCAALTLLSADAQSRAQLLSMGDRFVVKSLLSLTSSSVEKVCVQACECCRVLATEEPAQLTLVAMDALPQLHGILGSGSSAARGAALSLLNHLSSNPHLQEVMVEHGMLQALARVLAEEWANRDAVVNGTAAVGHLGLARGSQVLLSSRCVEVLLKLLGTLDAASQKEALLATLSSLAKLCDDGAVRRRLLLDSSGCPVARVVEMAAHCPHIQGRIQAMDVICHLALEDFPSQHLGPHLPAVISTLDDFLSRRRSDPRLLQAALHALSGLTRDPAVLAMVQTSPLGQSLRALHEEVEETRCLLRRSIGHSSSSSGGSSSGGSSGGSSGSSSDADSSPEPIQSTDPLGRLRPGRRLPPALGGIAQGASGSPHDDHSGGDDDDVDFDVITDAVHVDEHGDGGDGGDGDGEHGAWIVISSDDCQL
ncbi:uncharacterized protein LOC133352579 isoform X2 [Lethenteron reissneri]|uniref:uncharacterized protein LOC133352579 isoform X2 n=1 Tax=Lethenteron reissneri TaxID=7753 RepID=UPI002AB61427|nr:uncharacterized protein LOC133352579 isoform X2 [Lethenteron reissneri]